MRHNICSARESWKWQRNALCCYAQHSLWLLRQWNATQKVFDSREDVRPQKLWAKFSPPSPLTFTDVFPTCLSPLLIIKGTICCFFCSLWTNSFVFILGLQLVILQIDVLFWINNDFHFNYLKPLAKSSNVLSCPINTRKSNNICNQQSVYYQIWHIKASNPHIQKLRLTNVVCMLLKKLAKMIVWRSQQLPINKSLQL